MPEKQAQILLHFAYFLRFAPSRAMCGCPCACSPLLHTWLKKLQPSLQRAVGLQQSHAYQSPKMLPSCLGPIRDGEMAEKGRKDSQSLWEDEKMLLGISSMGNSLQPMEMLSRWVEHKAGGTALLYIELYDLFRNTLFLVQPTLCS